MEIKQAEFSLSAPVVSMCPKDTKPEYAFIGRSNVGKSSLINMLTNNRKLAKTSATPGKTLLINHFIINKEWYLVDLPGYVIFTKADKLTPNKCNQAVDGYKKKLSETWEELPPMFVTSAEKKTGRDDVLNYIEGINKSVK